VSEYIDRIERVEELARRQAELGLNNMELHRLSVQADPEGKGVTYQTIRRISEGAVPRSDILDKLEAGLRTLEVLNDSTAAADAA